MTPEPSSDDAEALPFGDLAPLAPARPAPADPGQSAIQRVWSLVTHLIPPVLLALAAAGTWWLVRLSPQADDSGQAPGVSTLPDFKMQRFSMQQYDAHGQARARIDGQELLHFPDRLEVEIAQVRMHWDDAQGISHVATANHALSDDATTRVRLTGQVTIVREAADAPARFQSEAVTVLTKEERVESTQPVRLLQGSTELRAQSFRYDHARGVADLAGGVRGTMQVAP